MLLAATLIATTVVPATAAAPARERGLWVGSIHLCSDTVEAAEAGPDPYSGSPTLTITLKPELRDRLRRETEPMVNRQISVRLDGETVMEPNVNEPLVFGALSLHGPSEQEMRRIADAASQDC